MNRSKEIIKVSIIGILTNALLVAFKVTVGMLANSIAIILDGINNLTDAISSVVTIIGTKLAGKAADKQHPYGHGRIEYLTGSVVAVIVVVAGLVSLKESFVKIIRPEETNYSWITILIIVASILVKFALGTYFSKRGNELDSSSLVASGTDAKSDAFLSASTLIAIFAKVVLHLQVEGIIGVLISVFILKAGIEIMRDTLNDIIGVRIEDDLSKAVNERINMYDEVQGAYDLVLHNYGPAEYMGSVHIEVRENMTAMELDTLSRQITAKVYEELGVLLTIGVYAQNNSNPRYVEMKEYVNNLIKQYEKVKQIHGFYVNEERKVVSFDLVFEFGENRKMEIVDEITKACQDKYEGYLFFINLDKDFSE